MTAPRAPGPEKLLRIARTRAETPDEFRLSLLGAFDLREGAVPIALPGSSQRLLAFLSIRERSVTRAAVAGTLWPEATEEHAHASLRTLLARLDARTRKALRVNVLDLSLSGGARVDLRDSQALAHRLLIVDPDSDDRDLSQAAIAALSSDLLPDWYEDWLAPAAAEWHELRLRALEALAGRLTAVGRYEDAVQAAGRVIAAEPLRETAQAALIRAYQAEGDRISARAAFERYRTALRIDAATEPTPELHALLSAPPPSPDVPSVLREVQTAAAGEDTRAFEVVASGISMEPSIRHGDKLLVSQDIDLVAGRIVVAVHGGVWIVKRLAGREGALVLRSDNVDEEVALKDVEVKGIVVELRRTL